MKLIETKNAVGHVLCHDLTRIVPGQFKGAQFRKGHVVTQEDIPMLLSMGKEHLYVWEMTPGMLHENDAAERLCAICKNENMTRGEVREGKIELRAACDGLFRVDVAKLNAINEIDELMIATRHSDTSVHAGDKLCGTRVIPLIIREEKLDAADTIAAEEPILELLPYKLTTAAVITTGSEVASGRIQDTFTPVLEKKLAAFGIRMTEHVLRKLALYHPCSWQKIRQYNRRQELVSKMEQDLGIWAGQHFDSYQNWQNQVFDEQAR